MTPTLRVSSNPNLWKFLPAGAIEGLLKADLPFLLLKSLNNTQQSAGNAGQIFNIVSAVLEIHCEARGGHCYIPCQKFAPIFEQHACADSMAGSSRTGDPFASLPPAGIVQGKNGMQYIKT